MANAPKVPADKVKYCMQHWPNAETLVDFDGVTYSWNPEDQKEEKKAK